jgi:predicted permease
VRSMYWPDDARRDLHYAIRTLLRAPGFTAVAVLTLALGIGANTAIFSVVNAILLRPLPYKNPGRLVRIVGDLSGADSSRGPSRRVPSVQVSELADLRSKAQTLSHVAFFNTFGPTLTGGGDAIHLDGARMSPEAFPMLGVPPLIGRTFESREGGSGADAVVILSYTTWQRVFGGARTVLDQNVVLDGRTYSVIGVMPESFQFPDAQTQFWVPFVETDFMRISGSPVARIKDGVSVERATAEVSSILTQLQSNRPTSGLQRPQGPSQYELIGIQDLLVEPVKSALLVLAGAVGFVLLIACANVANLLLARATARQREVAIRSAIGAGRGRLIRQALTESAVLAVVGGVAGTGLAVVAIRVLRTLAVGLPRRDIGVAVTLPRVEEIGVDASVLVFTVIASLCAAALFGLVPALRQTTTSAMDTLREGTSSAASGFNIFRRNRLQGVLVVSEIAMAMVLFVGGTLLIHSLVNLTRVDLGYDPAHVLTAQITLPKGRYTGTQLSAFGDDMVSRIQQLPGVQVAGYARQLPMVRFRQITLLRTTPEMPSEMPIPPPFDGRQLPEIPDTRVVSRGYLQAMGVQLVAGRFFNDGDGAGKTQVMLINQTLARSGFLGEHPLGRQIYAAGRAPWTVIGIVEDVRQFDLDRDPDPQIFIDARQEPLPNAPLSGLGPPQAPYIAVRTMSEPLSVAAGIRGVVKQLEPQATFDNVATMEQLVSNSISRPRLYAVLLGVFAGIAVALAAIGIYGVMAYSVAQRTREIGIRMALGAERADVVSLVFVQSVALTLSGVVLGLAGAAVLTRYLQSLLFGLTPLDPGTFIVVALFFAFVATIASYLPARRATGVDPLVALRCE